MNAQNDTTLNKAMKSPDNTSATYQDITANLD